MATGATDPLYAFHLAMTHPCGAVVRAWALRYPSHAADIRAHAAKLATIGMADIERIAEACDSGFGAYSDADRRRDLVPYEEVLREFGWKIANREARPPIEHRRHVEAAVARMFADIGYMPDTGRAG